MLPYFNSWVVSVTTLKTYFFSKLSWNSIRGKPSDSTAPLSVVPTAPPASSNPPPTIFYPKLSPPTQSSVSSDDGDDDVDGTLPRANFAQDSNFIFRPIKRMDTVESIAMQQPINRENPVFESEESPPKEQKHVTIVTAPVPKLNFPPKSPVVEMEGRIRGLRRMSLSSVEDLQSEESNTKPTFVNPINPQGNNFINYAS